MASLSGICVIAAEPDALDRLARAGIRLECNEPGPGNLWIDGGDVLDLARRISAALGNTTFAFEGNRTADYYCIVEYERGHAISTLRWLEGPWLVEPAGSRPWHAALLAPREHDMFDHVQAFMEPYFDTAGAYAEYKRARSWLSRLLRGYS